MIRGGRGVPGVLYNQGEAIVALENPLEILPVLEKQGGLGGSEGGGGVATVNRGGIHCQGMSYPKGDQIE